MDVLVRNSEEGMVFIAISERAMELFEEHHWGGEIVLDNPLDIFDELPAEWTVRLMKTKLN